MNTYLWYNKDGAKDDEGAKKWADSGVFGSGTQGVLTFKPEGDGVFEFFTHSIDMAGRSEIMKNEAECSTIYDTIPPGSGVSAPYFVTEPTIATLSCWGTDEGSGVANLHLYCQFELENFFDTGLTADETETSFTYHLDRGEGRYGFICIATDHSGNVQSTPSTLVPCIYDATPPETECTGEVKVDGELMFVYFTVDDEVAGIGDVALWYSYAGGEWQEATSATTNLPWSYSFRFSPTDGRGEYSFYSIGTDKAGNVEDAPDEADTTYSYVPGIPELRVFPESISFGEVLLNQVSASTLQLLNVGGADLRVTDVVVASQSTLIQSFECISSFPVTIGGEDYSTAQIIFQPTELGRISAVLEIWWVNVKGGQPSKVEVPVVGYGVLVEPPTISIEAQAASRLHDDDEIVIDVSVENKGPSIDVEAYIAVQDPFGSLYFWPDWSQELSGFVLTLDEGFRLVDFELMRISPGMGIAPGSYTFYAALAAPGSLDFMGPISTCNFDVGSSY